MAFLFSLFAGVQASAQVQVQEIYDNKPLQFTENKGQWNGDFLYKTDMGGGAAFLKRTGFTFLLQDKQQRYELAEKMHGHSHGGTDTVYVPHPSYPGPTAPGAANARTGSDSDNGSSPMPVPVVKGHAYEVTFLNAGTPEISAEKADESYSNYFIGNDPSKWKSNVKSYQLVNYKALYQGIDMQVYSEAGVLKYDLIVQPGADPSQIQLQYTGVDKLDIKKEQLIITTSVGTVTEQMPFAYQYIDNQRVPVKVSYALSGLKLRFKVSGKYDSNYPLIIDPSYIFSTVSGSQADNWGFTATYDGAGAFYGGGIVFNVGYPVTPGAVQNTYAEGGFDIGISKFSPNGRNLVYATYLGGGGKEQPHSLFVDAAGNLVISGRTTSGNYPGPNGGQPTVVGNRGGWDIAVTKINATGSAIIGSIIVASPGDDGVNIREDRTLGASTLLRNYGDDARSEVVIDNSGDIYVASCTRSDRFPVTPGVFQGSFGGAQDGVLLKINPDCNALLWASFIGGSKEDAAYVLALNGGTLYVAGGTASNNFPIRGNPIYGTYRGGICDGFIAHISADGASLLQSTYLGANTVAADQVYGIQLDSRGFVYVMGTTEGTWPTQQAPNTGSFYNNNSKQFISKLQPDLSAFVYSTTFGKGASTPSISPVAFLVDRCENVYVSGWGGGIDIDLHYPNSNTSGMPLKNPLQPGSDSQDFYFFVLQRDATDILFGSYFGGNGTYEHVDGGTSRFDRNGVIYQGICAWCPNSRSGFRPRYPTTPGAYATTAPPNCNLGALKIAFNLDGVRAGIKTLERRTNYCVPATITFIDTTRTPAQTWTWNFGDGSAPVVGTSDTVQHTYNNPGNYRVTLVKCDPASCNSCDTAELDLRIRTDRAVFDMTADRLPPCEELNYEFRFSAPTPPRPFTATSFELNFGDGTAPVKVGPTDFPYTHRYLSEGVYNATLTLVDTNYCNAPDIDTVTLRVAQNVRARFDAPDSTCVPATIEFLNTTSGGETFTWDFGDGSPESNEISPTHTYNNPGSYTVSLHAVDSSTCNITDDTTMVITVFPPPTADFDYSPTKPVENTPITFTNQSSPDAVNFLWEFGDGEGSTLPNPVYQYNKTGVYDVYLISRNSAGCQDTAHKQVSAIVIPLFDIPSAFSPNRDGVNDVFLVKGFGIAKFNMKIYNRWGQMVFETNDPLLGWDGSFKGAVQPMDAYAFVINVEFSDGTTATKNGSVTLLR
ncbi:PKD domain-containing protein [Chitinophaga sp. S165]|uniref:gliding motility-associated C-terminal domain-containing protein n=1 Tax=Chitinophaga sp. S165 TaxID=2135462 RepID=UPI000D71CF09|nr:PKD domain-containing protein [Chitinophaga sp. S165]